MVAIRGEGGGRGVASIPKSLLEVPSIGEFGGWISRTLCDLL